MERKRSFLLIGLFLLLPCLAQVGFSDEHLPDAANHIGTISLNDNAQFTTSTSVTLKINAAVKKGFGTSGTVTMMQFANDWQGPWSKPEPYATIKKDYSLAAPNDDNYPPVMDTVLKTVYVRFQDAGGNWSKAVSDSIILAKKDIYIPQIQEIHIAQQRPKDYDGTQPLGSRCNPHMISTDPRYNQPQFDALMYALMNKYGRQDNFYVAQVRSGNPPPFPVPMNDKVIPTVYLGPGVYETHGERAWSPQTGWRIIGAGKDQTTLKAVDLGMLWTDVLGGYDGDVACIDNSEISDLTLDCNMHEGGVLTYNGRVTRGINFVGNNAQVRRVRVKNFGSHQAGAEIAGLAMQNMNGRYGLHNMLLEDCDVVQPQAGNTVTPLMVAIGGEGLSERPREHYSYNIVVRNCYVNGAMYDGEAPVNPALYGVMERGNHGLGIGGGRGKRSGG